ncbi:hypothetical protein TIFTF001_028488 [Ficus carica]|uniref:Uncharacterized protein n=1 Tax=Ficus carica TaxID=3494 RepID=A0AA88DQ21_FICCA|nr:hypothetical protein TIFTF001_028488 [Ficus carica]
MITHSCLNNELIAMWKVDPVKQLALMGLGPDVGHPCVHVPYGCLLSDQLYTPIGIHSGLASQFHLSGPHILPSNDRILRGIDNTYFGFTWRGLISRAQVDVDNLYH